MRHVRGAPNHPQTQGKIERWHQTLKNRILLENYYLPGDLEAHIGRFIEHYNHRRYHENLTNLTPADVYFGRGQTILLQRERIKRNTIQQPTLAASNESRLNFSQPTSQSLHSAKTSTVAKHLTTDIAQDLAAERPEERSTHGVWTRIGRLSPRLSHQPNVPVTSATQDTLFDLMRKDFSDASLAAYPVLTGRALERVWHKSAGRKIQLNPQSLEWLRG